MRRLALLTCAACGWSEPVLDALPPEYVNSEEVQAYLCEQVDVLVVATVRAHAYQSPVGTDRDLDAIGPGVITFAKVELELQQLYKGVGNVSGNPELLQLWFGPLLRSGPDEWAPFAFGARIPPDVGSQWVIGLEDIDPEAWVDQVDPKVTAGLMVRLQRLMAALPPEVSDWGATKRAYDEWCAADLDPWRLY